MIKFTAKAKDGLPLLALGITDENVTRLRAGLPVHVAPADLQQMGLPAMHITIMHGADERAIIHDLRENGVDLPALVDEAVDAAMERR